MTSTIRMPGRVALVVTAAMILPLGLAGPASAQPSAVVDGTTGGSVACQAAGIVGSRPADPTSTTELSDAVLADITLSAEQDGITLAEAIDRYAWHEEFSFLVADQGRFKIVLGGGVG